MHNAINALVQKIHGTPTMASIAITGGGTSIFPMLLERGNGSKTLIGGFIPYDPAEHEEFLGGKSDRWVAEADARALAMSAYIKAAKKKPNLPVMGIGATSSLMRVELDPFGKPLPERNGRFHSIYIALQMADRTITHSIVYPNNKLPDPFAALGENLCPMVVREEEERLTAKMILNLLAEGCGLKDRCQTECDDFIVRKEAIASEIHPDLPLVLFGTKSHVGVTCGDNLISPMPNYNPPNGLIPGSFNPVHIGHRKMRAVVLDFLKSQTSNPVVGYEIAIQNIDKPPLDYLSLKERLSHLADDAEHAPVYITNATKFIDKARLFKECGFGVGYDTAFRITDTRYYDHDISKRDAAILTMHLHGAQFIVFGRKDPVSGEFLTLSDIDSLVFRNMSFPINEVHFREDIQSSSIRKTKEGLV